MTNPNDGLRGTAYHEAAHAVFNILYGFGVKTVTIIPTDEYNGECVSDRHPKYYTFDEIYFDDEASGEDIERYEEQSKESPDGLTDDGRHKIRSILAGYIATEILTGKPYTEEITGLTDHDFNKAMSILTSDEAGYRTVDADKLVNNEYKITIDLVKEHWHKIEAVAIELLKKLTLTGAEVERIIQAVK
jgi:ATP-dependent Zn protease